MDSILAAARLKSDRKADLTQAQFKRDKGNAHAFQMIPNAEAGGMSFFSVIWKHTRFQRFHYSTAAIKTQEWKGCSGPPSARSHGNP